MKKAIAIITIIMAAVAFGQGDSSIYRVGMDVWIPKRTVRIDAKGSPYIHIEKVKVRVWKLVEVRKEKRLVLDGKTGRASRSLDDMKIRVVKLSDAEIKALRGGK